MSYINVALRIYFFLALLFLARNRDARCVWWWLCVYLFVVFGVYLVWCGYNAASFQIIHTIYTESEYNNSQQQRQPHTTINHSRLTYSVKSWSVFFSQLQIKNWFSFRLSIFKAFLSYFLIFYLIRFGFLKLSFVVVVVTVVLSISFYSRFTTIFFCSFYLLMAYYELFVSLTLLCFIRLFCIVLFLFEINVCCFPFVCDDSPRVYIFKRHTSVCSMTMVKR